MQNTTDLSDLSSAWGLGAGRIPYNSGKEPFVMQT